MPLRVQQTVDNGTYSAKVINEFKMDFQGANIRFLVPPHLNYRTSAGKITSTALSDDKSLLEIIVSLDIPRETTLSVQLSLN